MIQLERPVIQWERRTFQSCRLCPVVVLSRRPSPVVQSLPVCHVHRWLSPRVPHKTPSSSTWKGHREGQHHETSWTWCEELQRVRAGCLGDVDEEVIGRHRGDVTEAMRWVMSTDSSHCWHSWRSSSLRTTTLKSLGCWLNSVRRPACHPQRRKWKPLSVTVHQRLTSFRVKLHSSAGYVRHLAMYLFCYKLLWFDAHWSIDWWLHSVSVPLGHLSLSVPLGHLSLSVPLGHQSLSVPLRHLSLSFVAASQSEWLMIYVCDEWTVCRRLQSAQQQLREKDELVSAMCKPESSQCECYRWFKH